jgi:pantothenate kinase
MQPETLTALVVERIRDVPFREKRRLIALVGSPASGKSTLSEHLVKAIPDARVVPMDGFHLDNRILEERGLANRKGSPQTFDVRGLHHLLQRLQQEDEVFFPLFDRSRDVSVAGAGHIGQETKTVVVEGNYLLLDAPEWRDLAALWDFSIYLSVPENLLRSRLMQRWKDHGFSCAEATRKTEDNDLPNAQFVSRHLLPADLVLETPANG